MKLKSTALAVLLILSVFMGGCSKNTGSAEANTSASESELSAVITPLPTAQPTRVPGSSPEEQRQLIDKNYDIWKFEDYYYSPWFYTVTDLDHNGRLEVISATTQGSGVFTTASIWEVDESFSGLKECMDYLSSGDDFPELVVDSTDCYYDSEENCYWYIFENLTKNGYAEQYTAVTALCLKDQTLKRQIPASREIIYSDDSSEPSIICRDKNGAVISEQDYENAAATAFSGYEKTQISLDWTMVEIPFEEYGEDMASPVQPTVQPTVQPASAYSGPAPVISKHPSSESISVGGKTWFIANASNASSVTWLFSSPQGGVFSIYDAMAANPGLELEALPDYTLALRNVPASFNGWAVTARFDGPGGTATTNPAYVTVGDYVSAYYLPIQSYRYAYQTGNASEQYAYQTGISPMIAYAKQAAYALKDMNKDNIPELIITASNPDDYTRNTVFGLYTLVNGQPVKLCESTPRDRWYILTDNRVLREGSSGASHQIYELYNIVGGQLQFIEGYSSSNSSDGSGSTYYHSTVVSPYGGGNYDLFDMTAPRSTAEAYIGQILAKKWMPQLTAIR